MMGVPSQAIHWPTRLLPLHGLVLAAMISGTIIGIAPHFLQMRLDSRSQAASQPTPDLERLRTAVTEHVSQWQPLTDPLVTLEDGRQAKSSHVNGIEVDGVRYFYRLAHGPNADPVSLGRIAGYEVVTVLEQGTQWETEVYRLP